MQRLFCFASEPTKMHKLTNLGQTTQKLVTMSFREFASAAELKVMHDTKRKFFYIPLSDNSDIKAILEYSLVGVNHVDMTHTGVPVELRGRGIAKQLAIAAFDYAVDQKLTVTPSCSYLQKFVEETDNQNYKDTVAT